MVLSAALSGNVWADLKDGLVAYYPFNGNAEDESGNGNDGTVNGATLTEDRFGNKESAYSFDGVNDYIEIKNTKIMNPNYITISAWYFSDKSFQGNGNNVIIHKPYTSHVNPHYQWHLGICGDQYSSCNGQTIFSGSIATSNGNGVGLNHKTNNFIGIWHHLVMSFDDTGIRFYLNGKLKEIKSFDSNFRIASYDTNIFIGKHGNLNRQKTDYTPGIIDDIRIYNRALSESEIQQLYKVEEEEQEKPKPPKEISSKAIYDIKTKTLSLKGVLVPFLDGFSREETGEKGIFNVQLQEKIKDAFELIPWSINLLAMFEGKDTSGYINYDHETRSVYIPCFKVATIAEIGDGIEGKAIYYKDVTMKQWNEAYPIFHIKDMTKADSCK